MPEPKPALPRVILCADDFALSREISESIAGLARRRCINAISCMANRPGWPEDAKLLDGIEGVQCGTLGRIQVGLHLALADERPLGTVAGLRADGRLPGPDRTLVRALTGRLDLVGLRQEIDRQFAAFFAARGKAPDFVDAHQHVHLYPGLRRAVIAATRRHAPHAWVRVPGDRLTAMLRRPFAGKAIGSALHAAGFRAQLRRAGLRSNGSFAGHYDFGGDFSRYLESFLRHGASGHLVMCHPGRGRAPHDGIARAREEEETILSAMPLTDRLDLPPSHQLGRIGAQYG